MKFSPAVLAIISAVSAVSTCNPTKQSNCPADPGLGQSFRQDFDSSVGDHFEVLKKNGKVSFDSTNGMSLTMEKRGDNPTIQSNFYIMFGKVEVVLKAAQGKGVISSFYLQSDDLDEIDIELFGGDDYEFQSNYFVKGDTTTYNRGAYHPTSPSPLQSFHTYTLEWSPEVLTWSLDGNVVRTITKDNEQGYPQSPMQLIAGVWAGGDPDNAQGTIEWAGGETDFTKVPFTMNIKSIIVADYSSGKSYSYGDQSGDASSIKPSTGKVGDREDEANSQFTSLQNGGKVIESGSGSSSDSAQSTESSETSSSEQSSLQSSTESSSQDSSSDSSSQESDSSLQESGSSSQSSESSPNLSDASESQVFILTGSETSDSNTNGDSASESYSDPDIVGISTIGFVNPTAFVTPGYAGQQGAQTQGQIQTLTTANSAPSAGSQSQGGQGASALSGSSSVPSVEPASVHNIGSMVSSSLFSILVLIASQVLG